MSESKELTTVQDELSNVSEEYETEAFWEKVSAASQFLANAGFVIIPPPELESIGLKWGVQFARDGLESGVAGALEAIPLKPKPPSVPLVYTVAKYYDGWMRPKKGALTELVIRFFLKHWHGEYTPAQVWQELKPVFKYRNSNSGKEVRRIIHKLRRIGFLETISEVRGTYPGIYKLNPEYDPGHRALISIRDFLPNGFKDFDLTPPDVEES